MGRAADTGAAAGADARFQTLPGSVLLCVAGGIAAYKAAELTRLLQQVGIDVTVLQTRSALDFVGPATFAALTGRAVLTDDGPLPAGAAGAGNDPFPHLDAGRRADVLVVAPATANIIARLSSGIADDVVTATYLAFAGPVIVCPAMNTRMWEHPATRRNIEQLRRDGVTLVEPDAGVLACGDVGAGRLAPVERIAETVMSARVGASAEHDLQGRTVLVTAGGTREPIDDARYISNRSSGRMGVAIARAAAERGADVRLIVTRSVDQALHAGIVPHTVAESAADLARAVDAAYAGSDVVVMAAAVSDYTVERAPGKLERSKARTLELQPTADILAGLGARRSSESSSMPLLVGFAAESGAGGIDRARAKLERKQVDMIVHNDVGRADIGFERDDNEVTIVTDEDVRLVPRAPKEQVAHAVLDAVARRLAAGPRSQRAGI